jgi:hypothetical protein
MSDSLTGGCQCGAVRHECAAEPLFKYYESRSDRGNTFSRGFCPTCGGRVFGKTSGFPQFILITAGSLDDPSRFKPSMDFFTASAQPWDHMDPALPKFPEQPKA